MSFLTLGDVTILISPFGFRNDFFSFHKSFQNHVLQFVSQFGVPELVRPKEDTPGVWVWVVFGHGHSLLQPHAVAGFVFSVFLFRTGGRVFPLISTEWFSLSHFT